MNLIVERNPGGDRGCYIEGFRETSFGGPAAAIAVERALKGLGIAGEALDGPAGPWTVTTRRLVFRVKATCPDCGGTGRYAGLVEVEPCGRCGGTGKA